MQEKSLKNRILEALQKSGLADANRIKSVVNEIQKREEGDVIDMISESGVVSDIDLLMLLSQELGIPPIDISRVNLDTEMMNLIPEKLARRYIVVPISKVGDKLTLIISDPTDIFAIDDIKTVTGCDVVPVLGMRRNIRDAIRSFYESTEEDIYNIVGEESEEVTDVEVLDRSAAFDLMAMTKESAAAPIVKMVDIIIGEAVKKGASDIHIEPQKGALHIRYRVDGQLHSMFDLPKDNQNAIIARVKIMSNLDIAENFHPFPSSPAGHVPGSRSAGY